MFQWLPFLGIAISLMGSMMVWHLLPDDQSLQSVQCTLTFLLTSFFFFSFFHCCWLHWFTHSPSYSLPYFLVVHYLLWGGIYYMCPLDFHCLTTSFFMPPASLQKSLRARRGRLLILYNVLMCLCTELKGYNLTDRGCKIQNLNDKLKWPVALETTKHILYDL